jgi:hypothetical protein
MIKITYAERGGNQRGRGKRGNYKAKDRYVSRWKIVGLRESFSLYLSLLLLLLFKK